MDYSRNVSKKHSLFKRELKQHTENAYNYVEEDGWNIALLLFLYLLQGIPLGLSAAIPIILQNRKVEYKDQAEFSFVFWPFSMKLLWAPIVDAVFSHKFGKRKSWLIPIQLLIGIFMLLISMNVDNYLGDDKGIRAPNIRLLTIVFFVCNFLAATQDIAVDGWALTMLHRKNIGHTSTCNSVGQTAGFFLGYVLFIALDSADVCNRYLFWLRSGHKDGGIISFSTFIFFWGIVYIFSTILVAVFKKEKTEDHFSAVGNKNGLDSVNIKDSYRLLWQILKLKPVQTIAIILLTVKIGFAATDNVGPLKLVENGVPKDQLALLAVPLIPLQIAIPFMISRYITGPRPMDCFVAVIPYRLFIGILIALLVYITPYFKDGEDFPNLFYTLLLFIYGLHQLVAYCMQVAAMSFFARVSDPKSGGTYMTLLNTLFNLGGTWSSTMVLSLVDVFTLKSCELNCPPAETCNCVNIIDGFYVETLICTFIGVLWMWSGKRALLRLQNLDNKLWLINNRSFLGKINWTDEEACAFMSREAQDDSFLV